jgi:dihydroorotate dehydrogenase/NAD-dependent dihydropyrimidine dehydrogenase PreA subunit
MQDAGASMIHLDLFYVPHPRCAPENIKQLKNLLQHLSTHLHIPIAPKLNNEIPAYFAARILRDTGIAAVFVLDSIRVPVPIDIEDDGKPLIANLSGARECSLFGEWQKPITLQYVSVLHHELGIPICAGGGLVDGKDAIEAMMLGAATVQFASSIIHNGFQQINRIREQISSFMDNHSQYSDIEQLVGLSHKYFAPDHLETYMPARAIVDSDTCIKCGSCTKLVFCGEIHDDNDGNILIEDGCDGFGLCKSVCPIPQAITIVNEI